MHDFFIPISYSPIATCTLNSESQSLKHHQPRLELSLFYSQSVAIDFSLELVQNYYFFFLLLLLFFLLLFFLVTLVVM